jgi:hypothetical protein
MRVASRIVGVSLALAGLGFLLVFFLPLLFVRESVLVGSRSWEGPAFAAILGVAFFWLAGTISSWTSTHSMTLKNGPPSRGSRFIFWHIAAN